MVDSKCPLCGSSSFFVKDPVDPYEIYEFDLEEGKIIFSSEDIGDSIYDSAILLDDIKLN